MKTMILAVLVSFSATAFAQSGAVMGTEDVTAFREVSSCTDPRLFKRFATEEKAYAYCDQLRGYNVTISVTYDWGYRAYTCSCYNNQNGGE